MAEGRYEERGVSPEKPDVHEALRGVDRGLFPGAFCHVAPDLFTGSEKHCLLAHADGAGTKSSLAYLHFREKGDATVFRGIAQDSLVMNLDDLLCVGCTGPFLLANTIGRNAKLVPGEVLREIILGYEELCERLRGFHVEVVPCGGETADVGDLVRTVIVDSTLLTRSLREEIIDCSRVQPGHRIVGFASFGKAAWETAENSGIGTNGFTSARHEILALRPQRDRCPSRRGAHRWAPERPAASRGGLRYDRRVQGDRAPLGEAHSSLAYSGGRRGSRPSAGPAD